MSTLTLFERITYETETCCRCGLQFALTTDFQNRRRRDHELFYCPAGHSQHYTAKSDVEQAREEVARQKQLRDQADAAAQQARAERDAAERKAKRLRHRVSGGTCPCCKRSFVALARHIATKHPAFVKEAQP